jgi:transcription factor C subunit 6
MRTRDSNRRKKFVYEKQSASSHSEEDVPRRRKKDEKDDENFDAQEEVATQANEDEEVEFNDSGGESSRARQPVKPKAPAKEYSKAVEVYNVESKATRVPHGGLKAYTRSFTLFNIMYGPDEEDLKIAYGMSSRWNSYEVLPSKLPDEDICPVRSPWLPAELKSHQEKLFDEWYARYFEHNCDDVGEFSHKLNDDEAREYLPTVKGDLMALLGPYDRQQEVRIQQNEGILLSDAGLPISLEDGASSEAAGWMFDVGGLVLAMKWAPQRSIKPQVLAIAVSPHTDQFNDQNAGIRPGDPQPKEGIIQLWEFASRESDYGYVMPDAALPQLKLTMCFDWGRARRLEWCPVPSDPEKSLGFIAILCINSVYVVEIPVLGAEASGVYGRTPPTFSDRSSLVVSY